MSGGTESTALHGTWQLIRAEFAGEAAPEVVVKNTIVVLSAGSYEVWFRGERVDRGTCESVAGVGPGTLVLHGVEGTNEGRTIRCLFQLRGDRLRVCYGLDGTMPAEMAAPAGQQRYLATYRRSTIR